MSAESTSPNFLVELSNGLASAVERAQQSMVRVDARRRLGATGLIWHADGLILTADHVIEREEEITIGLPDGRALAATIVGRDQGTDIAVLRADTSDLTPAAPAESAARIGQLVLALGRPRGESPMASLGVVSAVNGAWRTWRGGMVEGVIRTDATLYPGFSGGPLVDPSGRIIGLNTSVLARGLSVTLPWSFVTRVAQALVEGGKVKRGYLGVTTQPVALNEALRQAAGLTQESGLLIVGLEAESPAERGGLLLGDILVEFGGRQIVDIEALQDALGPGSAGAEQQARIVRAGQVQQLTLTAGER